MSLEFSASRTFGPFTFDAHLHAENEILVLFGHSGAGKSLTLRMAAGLLRPTSGRIVIDGVAVFDSSRKVDLPPQRRPIGYVVQELALFPHLTVAENIAFGMPGDRRTHGTLTGRLLSSLGLDGFERRSPRSLSGGQQQRVALARALARGAKLLLLDEPFSALDESLRSDLRRELVRLRAEMGLSILFVTHDLREAHLLADRIAVFDEGRVLQLDSRDAVFRTPASRRVAELTGVANVLRGVVADGGAETTRVNLGPLVLFCKPSPSGHGDSVDIAIRAERVVLRRGESVPPGATNVFPAEIVDESAFGPAHLLRLRIEGTDVHIHAELAARPYEVLGVGVRKRWLIELPIEDLHVMPV